MSKLDLLARISEIPDEFIIEEVNSFKCSLVVHCKMGNNIDETYALAFKWFSLQKYWKTLTLSKANGVSVTMVKDYGTI